MNWLQVNIGRILVRSENENGVLIKIPWQDWLVWLPTSMVSRAGGDRLTISFPEDWTFELFRTGKGAHNRRIRVAKRKVSATEFAGMFGSTSAKELFLGLFCIAVMVVAIWVICNSVGRMITSSMQDKTSGTQSTETQGSNRISTPKQMVEKEFNYTGLQFRIVRNPHYVPGQELLTGEPANHCVGYRFENGIIVASSVVGDANCQE